MVAQEASQCLVVDAGGLHADVQQACIGQEAQQPLQQGHEARHIVGKHLGFELVIGQQQRHVQLGIADIDTEKALHDGTSRRAKEQHAESDTRTLICGVAAIRPQGPKAAPQDTVRATASKPCCAPVLTSGSCPQEEYGVNNTGPRQRNGDGLIILGGMGGVAAQECVRHD